MKMCYSTTSRRPPPVDHKPLILPSIPPPRENHGHGMSHGVHGHGSSNQDLRKLSHAVGLSSAADANHSGGSGGSPLDHSPHSGEHVHVNAHGKHDAHAHHHEPAHAVHASSKKGHGHAHGHANGHGHHGGHNHHHGAVLKNTGAAEEELHHSKKPVHATGHHYSDGIVTTFLSCISGPKA